MLPVFRMGEQRPLDQDNSYNMRQLHGTILVETNFLDIYVLNYRIFWPVARALSIQKRSEIVKNEHARYTLERFPTDANGHKKIEVQFSS
jgi:hypothetical protein